MKKKPKGVRLEVEAPKDGRRCPAWMQGNEVWAHCGPLSIMAPIFVEYDRPKWKEEAMRKAIQIAKLGYQHVLVRGKRLGRGQFADSKWYLIGDAARPA